jgi:hypothetical protein
MWHRAPMAFSTRKASSGNLRIAATIISIPFSLTTWDRIWPLGKSRSKCKVRPLRASIKLPRSTGESGFLSMTAIAAWTKTLSSFIDPGIEEINEIDSNIGIKRK